MTIRSYLRQAGFRPEVDQPAGATDYVIPVGIFRLRVRVPNAGSTTSPALWVGFTAGGPLVERPSAVRYATVGRLVDDVVQLRRVFSGH